MKNQAHLFTSENTIADGMPRIADCGAIVDPAFRVFCWDSLEVGSTIPIQTTLLCGKCLTAAVMSTGTPRRYLYGISDKPPLAVED